MRKMNKILIYLASMFRPFKTRYIRSKLDTLTTRDLTTLQHKLDKFGADIVSSTLSLTEKMSVDYTEHEAWKSMMDDADIDVHEDFMTASEERKAQEAQVKAQKRGNLLSRYLSVHYSSKELTNIFDSLATVGN